eukprot:276104-Prorocentrum_minimum.AAC.5
MRRVKLNAGALVRAASPSCIWSKHLCKGLEPTSADDGLVLRHLERPRHVQPWEPTGELWDNSGVFPPLKLRDESLVGGDAVGRIFRLGPRVGRAREQRSLRGRSEQLRASDGRPLEHLPAPDKS